MGRIENKHVRNIVEWLLAIAMAFLVFFVLRTYVVRVAQVTGTSMLPTLEHGDMLLLNRFSYIFSSPRVGDIVAFPPYEDDPGRFYIKRIVAGPGDIVEFRNNAFYVNGERLADDFSRDAVVNGGTLAAIEGGLEIEYGQFFVLGDHRNGSRDSRFVDVGTVPAEKMVGRVVLRIWPLGTFGTVD